MSDEDDGSRSERIRERRRQSRERAHDASSERREEDTSGSERNVVSDPLAPREGISVKEDRHGDYWYLPDDQREELEYVRDRINMEWKREYGFEFEKNRHFRPLVVEHGLETVREWDVEDVREALLDLR